MSNPIRTIEDMEYLYYSRNGQAFLNEDDLVTPFDIRKDAPLSTGTSGVANTVFGAQAWLNLNEEANTFGMLPKVPWGISGWRLITVRAISQGTGGQSETGTLPNTVQPTFVEAEAPPKLIAQTFDNTEMQEYLAKQGGDDYYGSMDQLRQIIAVEHREEINYELNIDSGTLAGDNMESVDRICGSFSELNGAGSDATDAGFDGGDLDPYGPAGGSAWNDRDGGANVAVDAHVSHAANVNRTFTDSVLQGALQNSLSNGANPNGQNIQTGYDTWSQFNQIYDPQVRYNLIGTATMQPSVNGIKTIEGRAVGTQVATWNGKPIIPSKDTTQDSGVLSRIYMFDTSNPEGFILPRLSIRIAKPTQYFEAGINQGTPFAVNRFGTEGMYRTMGEIICTFFKAQAKIRDIAA